MIAVFSRPGREQLAARTLALLDSQGGAARCPGDRVLWWVGETSPPREPIGWLVEWRRRPLGGPAVDFFEMLRVLSAAATDLTVFEDDIVPCRNLALYVERRPVEWLTSYFNPWRRPVGTHLLSASVGFDCSQAITIPARLVERLAASVDPGPAENHKGQDVVINDWLLAWGEPVTWERSLVQHVKGPRSNGEPRARWLSDAQFVGEDFDALALAELPAYQPPPTFRGLRSR